MIPLLYALLYQTSAFARPGMMPRRARALLTHAQKLADNETAGHGDANLDRFNLLAPLL
jgi:hypothetical protein